MTTAAFSQNTGPVEPPLQVRQAWVRATVAGQKSSGGFMRLTSQTDTRLVGVASAAAAVAEVHEMKMDGDVMRMRPVPELALPAGKEVQFKPGGYHLMLMDLKQPLLAGSQISVTLLLRDVRGVEASQTVMLPVMLAAPTAAGAAVKPATARARAPADERHDTHKH